MAPSRFNSGRRPGSGSENGPRQSYRTVLCVGCLVVAFLVALVAVRRQCAGHEHVVAFARPGAGADAPSAGDSTGYKDASHGINKEYSGSPPALQAPAMIAPVPTPVPTPTLAPTSSEPCQLNFISYTAAAWEQEWVDNIEVWQNDMCTHMAHHKQHILDTQLLVDVAMKRKQPDRPEPELEALRKKLLSFFTFDLVCPGKPKESVVEYIEPLTAYLRDPFALCYSALGASTQGAMQSKRYIMLRSARLVNATRHRTEGRSILMDMGAGEMPEDISRLSGAHDAYLEGKIDDMGVSNTWFVYRYGRLGVYFTKLLLWEPDEKRVKLLEKHLPKELRERATIYTAGVEANPTSRRNPWVILRGIAKPGDFVSVKLDIDAESVERPIVEQLAASPEDAALVDEFFFEHHVRIPRSSPSPNWWHALTKDSPQLPTSYRLFTKLRRLGVRMHYWP